MVTCNEQLTCSAAGLRLGSNPVKAVPTVQSVLTLTEEPMAMGEKIVRRADGNVNLSLNGQDFVFFLPLVQFLGASSDTVQVFLPFTRSSSLSRFLFYSGCINLSVFDKIYL